MDIDIDKLARPPPPTTWPGDQRPPLRLDLRDVHVRAAIAKGAKIVISTDAHSLPDLDMMKYGVITARRGWAIAGMC